MKAFLKKFLAMWQERPQRPRTLDEVLSHGGWFPGRTCPSAADEFERAFQPHFHAKAREFVLGYGDLLLGHRLSTFCSDVTGHCRPFSALTAVLGCDVCPVGEPLWMGSESALWVDEAGKFYIVDEGIDVYFLASNATRALEIIFFEQLSEAKFLFATVHLLTDTTPEGQQAQRCPAD